MYQIQSHIKAFKNMPILGFLISKYLATLISFQFCILLGILTAYVPKASTESGRPFEVFNRLLFRT
jgi:hypothetical protein